MKVKEKLPVLSTLNLEIGYHHKSDNTSILKDINFEIFQGELVGIIGINGVGKSTLIRTLSGLQPALSGEIILNGSEIKKTDSLERAKSLSLVLTENSISGNLSVWELVALGRQPYTNWLGSFSIEDKQKVNEALEQISVTALATKKCYELSDGQLQKVMIARALAQETNLIILDEPTTHLDLYHQAYVFKTLKKLSKENNKAILFSTHELNLALEICDKILVLQDQSIYFDTPENLISTDLFNSVFPQDLIYFDKQAKSFRLKI